MPAHATTIPADVVLRDGTCVVLRAISPDDEPLMAEFHAGLSPRSVYQRYFHVTSLEQRIAHQRLALTCRVDPAAGAVVVAEHTTATGRREILALGRLTRLAPDAGEIALLVVDRWQRRGLGGALLRGLLDEARHTGIRRLHGDMLADNDAMRALVRRTGFTIGPVPGDAAVLRAELTLVDDVAPVPAPRSA
jgi:acetyltransferase